MIERIKVIGKGCATGTYVVLLGFGIWIAVLALDALSYFMQVSGNMHDKEFRPSSVTDDERVVLFVYSVCFLASSVVVARWKKDIYAGPKGSILYIIFLAAYLPWLDWSRGSQLDLVGVFMPLVICPLAAISMSLPKHKKTTAAQPAATDNAV